MSKRIIAKLKQTSRQLEKSSGGQPQGSCDEDEGMIQQCIEVARGHIGTDFSVGILQKRLRLGYSRARGLMAELELRGVVGPDKKDFTREVLAVPGKAQSAPAIPTARENYLGGNPAARRLFESMMQELGKLFADLKTGSKDLLRMVIHKAETARQIGIVLTEFTDTLPGKKLTKDFYEQHKADFRAAFGQTLEFEEILWFINKAKNQLEPIADLRTALDYRQGWLLAAGEEFCLEQERGPQNRHLPPDSLATFKEFFYKADSIVKSFREDERYFTDGRIRPDLRAVLITELEPKKKAIDDLWRELQAIEV